MYLGEKGQKVEITVAKKKALRRGRERERERERKRESESERIHTTALAIVREKVCVSESERVRE